MIVKIVSKYLLDYIKYCFLTGFIFFTLGVLLFIIINLKPDISFNFLSVFSFIDPAYKTGTFELDLKKTMQIFSIVAFILLLIGDLTKIVFKKLFNINIEFKLKTKKLVLFSGITALYFLAVLLIVIDQTLEIKLLFILAFFYFSNIVTLVGYTALIFE